MDHPALTLEFSDLEVWCENTSVPSEKVPKTLATFSVEGPRAAVIAFIKGTTAGAALNALAGHEKAVAGGYPTLVMRLLEEHNARVGSS